MSKNGRLKVEKEKEMRTKGSSKMISEGGLGADNYYNIVKDDGEKEEKDATDENKKDEENEEK